MVQTIDVEADRSGREDAPSPSKTVRLTECAWELLAERKRVAVLADSLLDMMDVLKKAPLHFGRYMVPRADLFAFNERMNARIADSGLLSDGALGRQDETEPRNGMNQDPISPSPTRKEGELYI